MKKASIISALLGLTTAEQLFSQIEPQEIITVTDQEEKDALVSTSGNGENPFAKYGTVYPNPTFQANVDKTIQDHPEISDKLQKVRNVGAATWIDSMANIAKIEPVLQGAKGSN